MTLPPSLHLLRLPIIASPMFIVSSPELVIAQCRAGIVGTMPSLNVREPDQLGPTLGRIADALALCPEAAPFGVNLVAHRTNARLEHDLAACIEQRVPLIITSLGPSVAIVDRVHGYGGVVFHDVISTRHARKAAAAGVDGLIAVAAGAGGHGGTLNPMAFIAEIRAFFDGPVVLAGAISRGADLVAARAMGAELAYMGTRMIATQEANAPAAYKDMIVSSAASDIIYSPYFSGVPGNYMRPSIAAAGLDPDRLVPRDKDTMQVRAEGTKAKAWKDIWSAGHGVGAIRDIPTVGELVDRIAAEFDAALRQAAWRVVE